MKKLIYLFASLALVALAACDGLDTSNDVSIDLPHDEMIQVELNDSIYYVTGVQSNSLGLEENGSLKSGQYLLISENLQDTMRIYNYAKEDDRFVIGDLLDDLFDIPTTVSRDGVCGLISFLPKYRYAYKVKVTSWRPVPSGYPVYICYADRQFSSIRTNQTPIIVESILKVE